MLQLIEGLPPGVVGVEAHEEVSAADYEQVLVPAIDAARERASDGRVSLLYVLGHEMPDYTAGGAWQDAKLGLGEIRSWRRIAVVTDAGWVTSAIHGLGWMVPGEVKVFPLNRLNGARDWVSQTG